MILPDHQIERAVTHGVIGINPFNSKQIQPASYDMRLDRYFRFYSNTQVSDDGSDPMIIDVKSPRRMTKMVTVEHYFEIGPKAFVLASSMETFRFPDNIAGRCEGKALALTTEIPTPHGWKLLGDLKVGQWVFSRSGKPTRITATTAPQLNRPCRKITFSDSTEVIADVNHLWLTVTKNSRKHHQGVEEIFTTRDIEDSLMMGDERNHHVRVCGPVEYPTQILPVDPYVLGVWLGDGTSTSATITCFDPPIVKEIERCGYSVDPSSVAGKFRIGRSKRGRGINASDSFNAVLRGMDLLGNKHVPEMYLVSNGDQRLSLLQGMMDSDGFVDEQGRCEYTSINERLAVAVTEIVCSLGWRAHLRKDRATLQGMDCGPRFRVAFTPNGQPFRLPRKANRLHSRIERIRRTATRSIVSVEEVESVLVRCIQVGNAEGMFLATRSYIPTHNSSLGRMGLTIHVTAGFFDPGFEGSATLELFNANDRAIRIYPGMNIAQMSFHEMSARCAVPYGAGLGSKYQGQGIQLAGPKESEYFKNFHRYTVDVYLHGIEPYPCIICGGQRNDSRHNDG